jgi:hypothetical protein
MGFNKSENLFAGTLVPVACFSRPILKKVGGLIRLNMKYQRLEKSEENERPGSDSYYKRLVRKMQIKEARPRRTF